MRPLTNRPLIGIIANPTSKENREQLIAELGEPKNGFLNPLKFTFQDFEGEVVPLDIQPNDILEKSGFEKGKKAMFNAVKYLVDHGAKVICFTASTKRLPGKFGRDIKKIYPDIIFTIGDNTTMISFISIMNHFLNKLDKKNDLVVCLGAGFLGEQSVNIFLEQGFKKIVLLTEQKVDFLADEVRVIRSLEELPNNIKFLAGCSHKYQINPETFKHLFTKEATILDVCVPPVVNFDVYQALPTGVTRYNTGDFYLEDVNYQFNPKLLEFPGPHFWYGCFTEAVMLNLAYFAGENLREYKLFEINQRNKTFLEKLLREQEDKILVPLINFFDPDNWGTIPF